MSNAAAIVGLISGFLFSGCLGVWLSGLPAPQRMYGSLALLAFGLLYIGAAYGVPELYDEASKPWVDFFIAVGGASAGAATSVILAYLIHSEAK